MAYSHRFVGKTSVAPVSPSELACVAAQGDSGAPRWDKREPALPGLYSAYSSGPFHVIVLCVYGSCLSGSALSPAQVAWLEQELACRVDRTATPFLIVALHPPLYHSSTIHRGDADGVRGALEPLLLRYGVDAVLAGHVHAFEATLPIAAGVVSECEGTVHVTVGTG